MALCNPKASSRKLVSESENVRPICLLVCFFGISHLSFVYPLLFIKDKKLIDRDPQNPGDIMG